MTRVNNCGMCGGLIAGGIEEGVPHAEAGAICEGCRFRLGLYRLWWNRDQQQGWDLLPVLDPPPESPPADPDPASTVFDDFRPRLGQPIQQE